MSDSRTGSKRMSPLPAPGDVKSLLGHIRGTLQALHGVRKQHNDAIRKDLLLLARVRVDGIIDTLGDCEVTLEMMTNHVHDLTGQGDGWRECACGYRINLGVKYVCSSCGYHPRNRAEWCALGCGSDYNKMWKVEL